MDKLNCCSKCIMQVNDFYGVDCSNPNCECHDDIEKKLKKANKLKEEVGRIKDFITLAKSAQTIDEKNAKSNELDGVNKFTCCTIGAYISTGSESPKYERTIVNNETIVCLMTAGLTGVEEKLKEKEEELRKLFTPTPPKS